MSPGREKRCLNCGSLLSRWGRRNKYCSHRCSLAYHAEHPRAIPHPSGLTLRQRQVVEGVWREKSYKQIAFELGLAEGTLKIYMSRVSEKLNVRGRVGLALWYERHPEFRLEAAP